MECTLLSVNFLTCWATEELRRRGGACVRAVSRWLLECPEGTSLMQAWSRVDGDDADAVLALADRVVRLAFGVVTRFDLPVVSLEPGRASEHARWGPEQLAELIDVHGVDWVEDLGRMPILCRCGGKTASDFDVVCLQTTLLKKLKQQGSAPERESETGFCLFEQQMGLSFVAAGALGDPELIGLFRQLVAACLVRDVLGTERREGFVKPEEVAPLTSCVMIVRDHVLDVLMQKMRQWKRS